jgi:hypothetical protein
MTRWIKSPADDLREVLASIGSSHISSEFMRAAVDEFYFKYDKRNEFGDDELRPEREPVVDPQTGWEE